MVATKLGKRRAALVGLVASVFSVLLGLVAFSAPAHAANELKVDWVTATSVRFSGIFTNPQTAPGTFMGNVYGTPPGTLTFVASTSSALPTIFGCKLSASLNVLPDQNGNLNYSKGRVVFAMTPPTTCTESELKSAISGLAHDPNIAETDLAVTINLGGVENRTPTGGGNSSAGAVNVTAGMGVHSDYGNLPNTDTFMLCEAKGEYANNVGKLNADCLAKNQNTLSAPVLNSSPLATIPNGKGPQGEDEKGWTGTFNNIYPGTYVVCSVNFQACQLFTKNSTAVDVRIEAGDTPDSTIPGTPPGQGAEEKVCTTGDGLAGTVAYILCPFTKLIADATSFFEKNIILPFMTVSPLTTNDKNPTYLMWQNVRNLANVGFILFFFFIIMSQATSLGLSNYGIKKVLPRLLIVALGINLSYFIVAFIIDAFNVFGAGLSQLVLAALQQASVQQTGTGTDPSTAQSIFVIGGTLLAAIVVTGGQVIGWLFGLIGIAFLFILVTVIVLVVRQIAIIMFVITAPVAILMYMLPNTEGFYTKWRKNLTQLLMMYPIIVLLFAAGKIFGVLINQPDFKIGMIIDSFGSIMFAPLHFIAQATGTDTDAGLAPQAVTAVKAGLSFTVNAVPLGAVPLTWQAGGWATSKVGGVLKSRLIDPSLNRKKQEAALMGQEARMRAAKVPVVGRVAGIGMRKNAVLQARQANLQHAQQEYVAKAMTNSARMQRQAAGVGGNAGRTRAMAGAAAVAAKSRKEDIDNESALLEAELRRLGLSSKEATSRVSDYLTGKSDGKITGVNGQELDLAANHDKYMRGMLNLAASQGEIGAVEAARTNSNLDQKMVDDIIRMNEGKLKEKGGYHLATNYGLAAGRMYKSDDRGKVVLDASGNPDKQLTDPIEIKAEMAKQRVIAMAQSGANSVAGMKGGLLQETADIITGSTKGLKTAEEIAIRNASNAAVMNIHSEFRTRLRDTSAKIVSNSNTLARTEASEDTIRNIGRI